MMGNVVVMEMDEPKPRVEVIEDAFLDREIMRLTREGLVKPCKLAFGYMILTMFGHAGAEMGQLLGEHGRQIVVQTKHEGRDLVYRTLSEEETMEILMALEEMK